MAKMLHCTICGKDFSSVVFLNGIRKQLYGRRFCLQCSPYGEYKYNKPKIKTKTINNMRECARCKITFSLSEFNQSGKFKRYSPYCKSCYNIRSREHKQKFKKLCIDYKGGSCVKCGYNKCIAALEFHHGDPNKKEFGLAANNCRVMTDVVKAELDKCELLCANCHREEHYLVSTNLIST